LHVDTGGTFSGPNFRSSTDCVMDCHDPLLFGGPSSFFSPRIFLFHQPLIFFFKVVSPRTRSPVFSNKSSLRSLFSLASFLFVSVLFMHTR